MKKVSEHEDYVLKHESGMYYKACSWPQSPNDLLTPNALEATRFSFKSLAEGVISYVNDASPRWAGEIYLKEVCGKCKPRKVRVRTEFEEVEE
jgi:hypothetical protein